MPSYDDTTMLLAVATGDQQAFAALFARHKDRAYTIALNYTNDSVVAEEVVQDVFLRIWKSREQLTEIDNFSAWLYTITRNRSLTALQKMARENREKSALISYLPDSVNDAERKIDEHYLRQLLEEALARLSRQQRRVFELSRLKGHSREEVAQLMGLSPATVSVHLTIALRTVRAYLAGRIEFPALVALLAHYL